MTVPALGGGSLTLNSVGDTCEQQLATANSRLQKALDAYDHAMALAASKDDVIAAKDALINLLKEGMAVKDQMFKDAMADADYLRKQVHPSKSKLRAFFDRVEKLLILAGGIYVGAHL